MVAEAKARKCCERSWKKCIFWLPLICLLACISSIAATPTPDEITQDEQEVIPSTEAADWWPQQKKQNIEQVQENLRGALGAYLIIIVLVGAVLVWKFLLDSGKSQKSEQLDQRAELIAELDNAKLAHTVRRIERERSSRKQPPL